MKIRLAIVVLLGAALCACQSAVTPVAFYMLGSQPMPESISADARKQGPAIVLERVVLAEYLRQSGLVLQTGPNQLQVSKTNLWAEGLDLSLPKALLQELQRQWPHYDFYLASDFVPQAAYKLRLNVDSFHTHINGEVIAEGRFQLIKAADNSSSTHPFRFTRVLHEDGYPYAVSQLQMLTGDLAALIGKQLQLQDEPAP